MADERSNVFQIRQTRKSRAGSKFPTHLPAHSETLIPFSDEASKGPYLTYSHDHKAPWKLKEWRYDIDADTNTSWNAQKPTAIVGYHQAGN